MPAALYVLAYVGLSAMGVGIVLAIWAAFVDLAATLARRVEEDRRFDEERHA